MKILADIMIAPGAELERVRQELVDELKASWNLYTAGVLREVYATDSAARVVFVLEAQDLAQARALLQGMPLIAAGDLGFELTQLRPFGNWRLLFAH